MPLKKKSAVFRLVSLAQLFCLFTFTIAVAPRPLSAQSADSSVERVLIRTPKPYKNVVSRIEGLGGKVTIQYKYVNAIAAEIPRRAMDSVRAIVGPNMITKDVMIELPRDSQALHPEKSMTATGNANDFEAESVEGVAVTNAGVPSDAQPNAYRVNNSLMNVSGLHAGGNNGLGVIVAVIDSGIRPGRPHLTLDGSVVGCEDFVGDALGCSNNGNNGHGTFVAGMISANVNFVFGPSAFRTSVLTHCPGCFLNPPLNTTLPMIGSAPRSSIYALRVFGPSGGGPTSTVLQAVERVIELRELFDAGDVINGRKIQVCNMSLGGATLFAGRDLFDTAVNVMLDKNIVLTVSSGNAGPSSLTAGSPGSALESLTVGAASHAHNERILRDLQFGAGIGSLWRPFSGSQTADFSSRGPTADGRIVPDVTASGLGSFGQGFAAAVNSVSFSSGTSFSSPSVAGVAAVLRQAFPAATARQIRNAIILSANPNLLADGSTELDQGSGFVDAQAAANLLATGTVPNTSEKPKKPKNKVVQNVIRGTLLNPLKNNVFERAEGLMPGQRADYLYEVREDTAQVVVNIANFVPGAPQNALFGDDILLTIHTAKTSAIGEGDYEVSGFTTGGTFVINNPEPGLMRITVNGDTTNASPISADVSIASVMQVTPSQTAKGKVNEGDTVVIPVNIPAGVSQAVFSLSWKNNWSKYPTNDVDMILVNPASVANFNGATLNSPESAVVNNPMPGTWFILVNGFEVNTKSDKFDLRVTLDGQLLKQ